MTMLTLEIQGILHKEWIRLKSTDPELSLRGFAKILNLPVSSLSEILNGKRPASFKLANLISSKLALDETAAARLLEIANTEKENKKNQSRTNPNSVSNLAQTIPLDQYATIADWFHFALMQLTKVEGFQSNAKWIASRLDIEERQAEEAIERLIRLELISRDEQGNLKATTKDIASTDNVVNLAVRKGHSQLLKKAQISMEMDPIEIRDLTSLIMSVDVSKMKEARQLIRKFRDDFFDLMETGDKKEVYCLSVQYFPLSEKEGGE